MLTLLKAIIEVTQLFFPVNTNLEAALNLTYCINILELQKL